MHLKKVSIQGYKNFEKPFSISFTDNLNVLVGENGVGKTGIINSIRMLLQEDEFGRSPISDTDFFKSLDNKTIASEINITGVFGGQLDIEEIAFLPWANGEGDLQLNLQIDNKTNNRGRFKRAVWGGEAKASAFEWELFDTINCIYLPPLRDAEAKLRESKSSRLARLMKNICKTELEQHKKNGTRHELEEKVKVFNEDLSKNDETIVKANKLISTRLKEALGDVFGQETHIQYAELNFNRIVESLRLLFFPKIGANPSSDLFRSLEENSLGYNNILYLATVLAELTEVYDEPEYVKVLLIEEPEAHLHPQLQIRLLKYLESIKNVQIIVTTHSPVLASAVSIESLIHLSVSNDSEISAISIKECGLTDDVSLPFLRRWFDATKSTLLFAKGVILVEGIAEAMLIPEMAKIVLKEYNDNDTNKKKLPIALDDGGISVVNLNGIYFKHFLQLFCNLIENDKHQSIPIRCAGITDQDPPKKIVTKDGDNKKDYGLFFPILSDITSSINNCSVFKYPPSILNAEIPAEDELNNLLEGKNHALSLIDEVNKSDYARLFANQLKTLEYDLAMESGNLNILIPIAINVLDSTPLKLNQYKSTDWGQEDCEEKKARASYELLKRIEDKKGEFAQSLADEISTGKSPLVIPEYIKKAIIWACGGNPDA